MVPPPILRHPPILSPGQLGDRSTGLDRRIGAYRDEPVDDPRAHDLVIRAVDCRATTPSQVPEVVQEWREPSHAEFRPRNLWSLFNAFTEVYKGQNPGDHGTPQRGAARAV